MNEMQSIGEVSIHTKMYERIAARGFPNGTALLCAKCGTSRLLTVFQTAQCLMNGWPRCCDRQMQVNNMPEVTG